MKKNGIKNGKRGLCILSCMVLMSVSTVLTGCGLGTGENVSEGNDAQVTASGDAGNDATSAGTTSDGTDGGVAIQHSVETQAATEITQETTEKETLVAGDGEFVINTGMGEYIIEEEDEDNEYIAKLAELDLLPEKYADSVVTECDNYLVWYCPVTEGVDTWDNGIDGQGTQMSSDELQAFRTSISTNYGTYISGVKAGTYPAVDFNGDGVMSYKEAMIASIYVMSDEQEKAYAGSIIIGGDSEVYVIE